MSPYSLFDVSLSLLFRCFVLFFLSLCACAVAISTTEYESVLRVLKQWSADRLRALYYDVIITSMTHCLQCCRPKEKSSNWHFLDFHFFAKNYNLVNALSCVLVIFLGKKIKCLEMRFFRFAKSSICICTYEIFHVSPRKKAVSSSPRKKAVSAERVLFFSLFIITISLLIKYCCFLPVYRHTCRKFLINWIEFSTERVYRNVFSDVDKILT